MPRTTYSAVYSKWVGQRIRKARNAVGITQAELARRLNASGPYVAAVEAGRENLTVGQLASIAEALGVVLDITLTLAASEYGQRLRKARIAAGMTQAELGKRLNLAQTSISEIEHGVVAMTDPQLTVAAEVFGVKGL